MSPRAAWRLESIGFTRVYDYVAGKADWGSFGLPLQGTKGLRAGEFVRADGQTKRLVNVDVDYVDEYTSDKPRRALTVKTLLTDTFNQAGYEPTDLTPQTGSDFVETHVNQLHDLSKNILANIISSEMAERIALGG